MLFVLASRDDPELRRSVTGLAVGTAIGVGLLIGASFLDGFAQGPCGRSRCYSTWATRSFSARRVETLSCTLRGAPRADHHHRARRVDRRDRCRRRGGPELRRGGRRGARIARAAALWWIYFDVVALVAARRLAGATVGREQNEMARDSYSYIHFAMVAGIVLVALD